MLAEQCRKTWAQTHWVENRAKDQTQLSSPLCQAGFVLYIIVDQWETSHLQNHDFCLREKGSRLT